MGTVTTTKTGRRYLRNETSDAFEVHLSARPVPNVVEPGALVEVDEAAVSSLAAMADGKALSRVSQKTALEELAALASAEQEAADGQADETPADDELGADDGPEPDQAPGDQEE